jgi:transcriptional regulator with XRE-family HTH domain
MNNLQIQRRTKGLTQEEMSELTGIPQSYYSEIERGKNKPHDHTKQRIEKVLGRVDWIETGHIQLHNSSWYRAESLLKKLVEATFNMDASQKSEFTKMVHKYFK